MKLKKLLALLCATMMLTGTLVGCGGAASASTEMSEDSTSENEENSGDIPTFTVATVRYNDQWPKDFLETGVFKELEEKAGVNIEWQVYYTSDWNEQKSLMFASGDLPDAFFGSLGITDSDVSQNKASLIDMTDMVNETNMPNLMKVFEEEPQMKAMAYDRDGKIYSLVKKLPLRPVCGWEAYINQEWMDNLGLDMPTTLDELTAVLKAFATEDADGDGDPTNEIPVSNWKQNSLQFSLNNYIRDFGTVSNSTYYTQVTADDEPVFTPAQDRYKDAVIWMHDLYTSGVLDPEFFTQEDAMYRTKCQKEGGSQVGLLYGWTADAYAGDNVDQFALLPAPEGPDGNHYVSVNLSDISDRELIITNKCSNPEKLLQWADLFYDDLVSLQTFYGYIGSTVVDNGDGTYDVVVPEGSESLDIAAWENSPRDFGPKYMKPEFYDKVKLPTDQGDGVKLAEDKINAQYGNLTDQPHPLPNLKFTGDENARLTVLITDIQTYVEAQFAHWVVDGGVENEWDSYIKQLDDMGVQELMEIITTAYRAYEDSMN